MVRAESLRSGLRVCVLMSPAAPFSDHRSDVLTDPTERTSLSRGQVDEDVLIYNVGPFDVAPSAEIDDAEWPRYVEVNLMGAVRLSRCLLLQMLESGLAKLTRGTEATVKTVLDGPTYSYGVAANIERIAAAQSMSAANLRRSAADRGVRGGPDALTRIRRAPPRRRRRPGQTRPPSWGRRFLS
jgi:NAD(P)-dependent dehydrogenase (short-subunit alcohol dehydrogenase family)